MGLQSHLPISVLPQTLPGVISSGSHLFIYPIIGQTSIGFSGVLRVGLGSLGVTMFQALGLTLLRSTIPRLHGCFSSLAAGEEAGRSTVWLLLRSEVLSFQNHLLALSSTSQPQVVQCHSCVLSGLPQDNEEMNLNQHTFWPQRTALPGVKSS